MTDGRRESRDCRPASPRDWLAAQIRVRFGRLNRFAAIRAGRDILVRILARDGTVILFFTSYGFQILLPATYTSLIVTALDRALFHPALLVLSRRAIRRGDVVVDGGSNIGFLRCSRRGCSAERGEYSRLNPRRNLSPCSNAMSKATGCWAWSNWKNRPSPMRTGHLNSRFPSASLC